MTNKKMTFEAFKASRKEVKTHQELESTFKDVAAMEEDIRENESFLVYAECMQLIKCKFDNKSTLYRVHEDNHEHEGENLEKYERIIYTYYMEEIAEN